MKEGLALALTLLTTCGSSPWDSSPWDSSPWKVEGVVPVSGDACGSPPSTNLVYLLDGDNINGSANAGLTHGDAVTTWENQAPGGGANDAVAPSGTARPLFLDNTFNGHDALSFDGQGDRVALANSTTVANSLVASRRGHIISVIRVDSPPVSAYTYFIASSSGSPNNGPMIGINSNSTSFNYLRAAGSPAFNGIDPGVAWQNGKWHGYEYRLDNSTLRYKIDGSAEGSTSLTVTTQANLDQPINIGCAPAAGSTCANIAVAFVAIYTDSMNSTDRAAMRDFLACRYTLTLY